MTLTKSRLYEWSSELTGSTGVTGHAMISANEFKSKCLDLLDRVARRELSRLTITKRGSPGAALIPPPAEEAAIDELYGCLCGTVIVPTDIDLTDPVIDDPFSAAAGSDGACLI
ncbi:MAG: type II toxin-antitoxin system Phd/YefM family antitoxin [Stellaceae bacterium]